MNWFVYGATFDIIGKILIGIAVLLVHKCLMKEHKIGIKVIKKMKLERLLVILGIGFMIIGYLIHVFNGV